jgi:hypothetical protein
LFDDSRLVVHWYDKINHSVLFGGHFKNSTTPTRPPFGWLAHT